MAEDRLPKFDAPPVIETLLGVQFARFATWSSAMAGWFWKKHLSEEWSRVQEAPRLDDQFERFDEQGTWLQPSLRVGPPETSRVQIIHQNEERMIQLQDSRFVLNWRKREGQYPNYATLRKEFYEAFNRFEAFTKEAQLGEVEPNQWEVVYVNHIPRNSLWQSPADWQRVIPRLFIPTVIPSATFGGLSGDWRFDLADQKGRLYVNLRHLRLLAAGPDFLSLQLIARGPVDPRKAMSLERGFDLGHAAIVQSFTAMTSDEAHKHWQRRI